ncbi:DUF3054 domain-containing protein [Terrabacter sp. MAHUQ-38]|jgi:hypothetical protein|uniref:DUF3054 domain-containing protein n=1 Tax=unclassified Terrabacter TaxID=2630222 RepID=UPI00165DB9DD|nr:DUF3054 domain-containing protein [Terrabacter sp. MAHUQ-38]MBC9823423.1 DUF3054 domain-containing protein [Terrabacter sp. MAHUQ-38]
MIAVAWWRSPVIAFAIDVLLIIVFAVVGRASHGESNAVVGVLSTAVPFLAGTATGWLVVRVMRRTWPVDVAPGVTVWFATLVVGMVMRHAVGAGTAASFIVVASLVLAAFLLGWRALGAYAVRRFSART